MIAEPPDLTLCDREPIHIPASIQPYGLMLVATQDTQQVRHVAGDVEGRLGLAAWDGVTLAAIIGPEMAARLDPDFSGVGFLGQHQGADGAWRDVSAHRSGAWIIVELEPAAKPDSPSSVLNRLEATVAGFERAASLIALCDRAAVAFRQFTGFDRVMVYRFLDSGAGRVVAEDRRPDLHAFLNHHFPAGDIPRQARALYLRNLIRVIPDIAYHPAPLRPAWTDGEPLDMSDTVLRSVSPVHIQYLHNMGVQASASISIVRDGALWGMIACHHTTPRRLGFDVRATSRALASALARQIRTREEAEGYRQRLRLRASEDDIMGLLAREGALEKALSHHLSEVGRMLGGDGVAVLRGEELVTGDHCPHPAEIRALATWLLARDEPVFATDALETLYPPAEAFREIASGVLAVTLSAENSWLLLWFRAEHVETLEWAGNPHKTAAPDSPDILTPRASFEAWRETVRGRARAWATPELEAARRLRASLIDIRQRRQLQELNRNLTRLLEDKDTLLAQKEFLIGEVNHRVQNSLQLVSSFLALQARGAANPALVAALEEARRRLSAVALVHRRLYRGDHLQFVDGARYFEELCAESVAAMGREWAPYLALDLAPLSVSTDCAITLGLVLTELLINTNKYAYGGVPGPIEIRLASDAGAIRLTVADQGAGKNTSGSGFGSRMMEGLVGQLGGTLVYGDNQPGLVATVTIPG